MEVGDTVDLWKVEALATNVEFYFLKGRLELQDMVDSCHVQ